MPAIVEPCALEVWKRPVLPAMEDFTQFLLQARIGALDSPEPRFRETAPASNLRGNQRENDNGNRRHTTMVEDRHDRHE